MVGKYDNLAQEPQLNHLVEVAYVEWEAGSIQQVLVVVVEHNEYLGILSL